MNTLTATAAPRLLWRVDAQAWQVMLLCLVIAATALLQTQCFPKPGELGVYLTAAERMLHGESVYRTEEMSAFCYPPFFALVFVPLTCLPPSVASWAWNAINLGLLMWTLISLDQLLPARNSVITGNNEASSSSLSRSATSEHCRNGVHSLVTERLSSWRYTSVRYLLLGLLATRFVLSPLEYRSHDLILFALLTAALCCSVAGQESWLGMFCGLATACKATPLLFLPMLLLRGRWQAAAFFIVACGAANFLPDVLCPAKSGELWSQQWYQTFVAKVETTGPVAGSRAWRAWNHLNQGLAGTLYRLTTPAPRESAERVALDVTLIELSSPARGLLTFTALAGVFILTLACVGQNRDRTKKSQYRAAMHQFAVFLHHHTASLRIAAQGKILPATNNQLIELGTWSVLLCAMLLLSPMSSKQHFCTLLIPLAYVLDYFLDNPKRHYFLACGLALVFLLGSCLVKDLVGRPLGNLALSSGSLTWCALVAWSMSAYVLWQDRCVRQ